MHSSRLSFVKRLLTSLTGCLLVGLFSLTTFAQTTRFVSTTGTNTDPASATSWATSTTNLQGAINSLSVTGGQVWVAAGVYKPGGNANTNRSISFQMRNNVTLYGGFVGNETLLSQRPVINPIAGSGGASQPSSTTLSGEIGNPGSTTDNSFHVFNHPSILSLNSTARLDGVVISGGYASGIFPDNSGGAIYNSQSNPSLTNCSFQNNNATSNGGAIYNSFSSPSLTNCSFQNNTITSNGSGGAIFNSRSSPSLTNCNFQNNTASFSGGAIYNSESNPSLINCSFQSNNTNENGGAIANDTSPSPSLTNCSFLNNTATGLGGAIRNFNSTPSLTNCVLFGNGGANTISNVTSSTLTASYSLFDQSVTGYTSVTGNITTTVSPFASTTSTQLAPTSPAINMGNPATTTATAGLTDLAGNPRFVNTLIDMGAYEFQSILEVFTLKDGLWNEASTWSVGRLPLTGERVRLRHVVTMRTNFTGQSGVLVHEPGSRLMYEPGGRLQLGQ